MEVDRGIQIRPDNEEVKMLMFADDIVLIADTPTGLTHHVNALSDFCTWMDMSVNLNKTKAVVFLKGGRLMYYENWYLDGKEIECV